jgi:hypothetical protein
LRASPAGPAHQRPHHSTPKHPALQPNRYLITVDLQHLAEAIYKAPFVCLAHNSFEDGVDDPTFVYANRAALRLFDATWDELVGAPSRISGDESVQEVRRARLGPRAQRAALQWTE